MFLLQVFCLLVLPLVVDGDGIHQHHHPLSRVVEVSNESGEKLTVDWYNPDTGELIEFAHLRKGEKHAFGSFVNHTFSFRVDDQNNTACQQESDRGSCPSTLVTVNDKEEQVIHIKRGLKINHEDSTSMAAAHHATNNDDAIEECRQNALYDIADGYDQNEIMQELAKCLQEASADAIERKSEQLHFETHLRLQVSKQTENYTCADNELPTTSPIEIREWTHNGVTRPVHVLHERQASKIHMLDHFISPEECEAVKEAAKPRLHRGTVANGQGGSMLSDNRKAMQAGIPIPWEKEADGDLIAQVVRRLYDYTNHATGYNLTVEGQEDLMSIQYFGRGEDDTAPDRYTPHCDGDCDGLPHKTGGRVATMVMYCDAPTRGGGTNFQNSGVYVKPKVGAAAFFAYHDPVTGKQETGFTSHSGCPVIEGTKRIAVQWMRIGVDLENPWDSFNTLTIKNSEMEDC